MNERVADDSTSEECSEGGYCKDYSSININI